MSGTQYYNVHVNRLVYKWSLLPKDAPERKELEESIRYLYRSMSAKDFERFLFLVDLVGSMSRAIMSALGALGLEKLKRQICERSKEAYSG